MCCEIFCSYSIIICNVRKIVEVTPVSVTHRHSYKLIKKHCKLDVRKYFAHHVFNNWNKLDYATVNS